MNENKIMNQTIEKMLVHASVRDFKAEPLPAQTKDLLLKAAQSGASSNFIQAYSIIEVADVNLRCEIAKISGSDAYVNQTGVFYVFVADWYRQAQILRAENKDVKALRNMEALTVAIVDKENWLANEKGVVNAQKVVENLTKYLNFLREEILK